MAAEHRGKWQGSVYDIQGKRRKKSFATKAQAEAWERSQEVARDQIKAGLAPAPKAKRTVASFWEGWIARRPPKRAKDDRSKWTNHVGPFFGEDDIDSIDRARLQEFVRHMESKTSARHGQLSKKPLKENTIKRSLDLIGTMIYDLTERRIGFKYKVPTTGYAYLEQPEDIVAFLAACEGWFKVASAIALYAGLRKGEVAGLRRADIRFDLGSIEVNHSYEGPVKSKHHRYVSLPPELVEILEPWVQDMKPEDFVITINGKMMHEEYDLASKAEAAAKRAGVTRINFHQTRHTYGSHLAQREPLTVVGHLMGHIDPKTTQRYAHQDPTSLARNPRVHLSFKASATKTTGTRKRRGAAGTAPSRT
jgi:integrase